MPKAQHVAAAVTALALAKSELEFRAERKERPIDGGLHHLAHQVSGTGASCIVFLHGWPDDPALWHTTIARLKPKYRCVNVSLPGYAAPFGYTPACLPERKWGFDLDEAAALLHATIKQTCAGMHVTLMIHDWGCIVGYLLLSQCKVDRVVSVDVGWFVDKSFRPLRLISGSLVLLYQGALNLWFLLPSALGDVCTSLESRLLLRTSAKDAGPVLASSASAPIRRLSLRWLRSHLLAQ
jgi:pimeloyl-ACP methyl ester carboxylesterase